jgi:hypothetical protein
LVEASYRRKGIEDAMSKEGEVWALSGLLARNMETPPTGRLEPGAGTGWWVQNIEEFARVLIAEGVHLSSERIEQVLAE